MARSGQGKSSQVVSLADSGQNESSLTASTAGFNLRQGNSSLLAFVAGSGQDESSFGGSLFGCDRTN